MSKSSRISKRTFTFTTDFAEFLSDSIKIFIEYERLAEMLGEFIAYSNSLNRFFSKSSNVIGWRLNEFDLKDFLENQRDTFYSSNNLKRIATEAYKFKKRLKKDHDFIDKKLYEKQLTEGVKQKLIGFRLLDKGIPRKDYKLLNSGDAEVGRVTSGTMSPILKQGIGLGYLKTKYAVAGCEIFVQVRNKKLKAEITELPFIKNKIYG